MACLLRLQRKFYYKGWVTTLLTTPTSSTASLRISRTYKTSVSLEPVIASPTRSSVNDLLRRNDFLGVLSREPTVNKGKKRNPETVLTDIQNKLVKNFRVPADILFLNVVQSLEENDSAMMETLRSSSERWVPMLLASCGSPLSNVKIKTREEILNRLWTQIIEKEIPLSIDIYNSKLQSLLENETDFQPLAMLNEIEIEKALTPIQKTFELLLEQIAIKGDVEASKNMVYEMARHGCVFTSACNTSLVYCFSLHGHHAKAKSLISQSANKYDQLAFANAQGARARAVAANGDLNELRDVLRSAVTDSDRLIIPHEIIFQVIWLLSKKFKNDEYALLTEQMLNHVTHSFGFFRYLFREVDKHISNENFYTAITLLEDTKRVADSLNNQHRTTFLSQMLGKLCRQLITSKTDLSKITEIAHRCNAIVPTNGERVRVHDDLLYAVVTHKDLSLDERVEYLKSFVEYVDKYRERHHVILPLFAGVTDIDDRLNILFRCTNLGYKDISKLDIGILQNLILVPAFERRQYLQNGQTRLDKLGKVLKSYGVADDCIWKTMYNWMKFKEHQESKTNEETWTRPYSKDLKGWLKYNYKLIYENPKSSAKPVLVKPKYEKFKEYVESNDISKTSAFLSTYGWPENTNFEEIVPQLLELYLNHESWDNVERLLISLSRQSHNWTKGQDKPVSPVKNFHILQILRRLAYEKDSKNLLNRKLIDFTYKLHQLFPYALMDNQYDTVHIRETVKQYRILFQQCFERFDRKMSVDIVDQCIDLLRTLLKLNILFLQQNETLTINFVNNVLFRLGWNEGLNTWMKFQSGLQCTNGMVALLRYSLYSLTGGDNEIISKSRIQYVLHKAQNFIPASRVHALYTAVLVEMNYSDKCIEYMIANKSSIDPYDCTRIYKLMNATASEKKDNTTFLRTYPELCLEHTSMGTDIGAANFMQSAVIDICERKMLAPLAFQLYEVFKKYNTDLPDQDKRRLWAMSEKYDNLVRKWIYSPHGFLKIEENDLVVQEIKSDNILKELEMDMSSMPLILENNKPSPDKAARI